MTLQGQSKIGKFSNVRWLQSDAMHVFARVLLGCGFMLIYISGCGQPLDNNGRQSPVVDQQTESDQVKAPELSLSWQSPDHIGRRALLTLRNTSDIFINIDKELVFCVNIEGKDKDGQPLRFEEVKDSENLKLNEGALKERIITLKPGETAQRTIDLENGFKVFESAVASDENGIHSAVSAYECRMRMQPGTEVTSLGITYERPLDIGFHTYTGKSFEDVDLFVNRLHATITRE